MSLIVILLYIFTHCGRGWSNGVMCTSVRRLPGEVGGVAGGGKVVEDKKGERKRRGCRTMKVFEIAGLQGWECFEKN